MKFVAALTASLVTGAVALSAAQAADLRPAMPTKAPIMAPYTNWTGFYIGGVAGYAWGDNAVTLTGTPDLAADFADGVYPGVIAGDAKGFLGGVQWGTNWQFGQWVLGIESDWSFADINHREAITVDTAVTTVEQNIESFRTTRARVGYLVAPDVMIYGTGGLATGRVEIDARVSNVCPFDDCAIGSAEKTRYGWTAGGGVEWMMFGNWSAKVEYLHYDLGTRSLSFTDINDAANTFTAKTRFSGDMIRGAINYHFNWTPWQLLFGGR